MKETFGDHLFSRIMTLNDFVKDNRNFSGRLRNSRVLILTLIREFLGPSPSAFSGKKSRIIAGDVTVETEKMKMICADSVS